MTRTIKNFLKNGNFRNSKDKSETTCYRCKKPVHIKPNCPLNKNNDKKARFKKALEACWEDDTSSEDEANMCFTVKEVPTFKEKWIMDSGCSKHMTGKINMLLSLQH